jgi:hypothetical protein
MKARSGRRRRIPGKSDSRAAEEQLESLEPVPVFEVNLVGRFLEQEVEESFWVHGRLNQKEERRT